MTDRAGQSPAGGSGFDLADARRCLGVKVDEVSGAGVGRVQGLLVDAVDGSPTWLIVKLGRIGRRAAVPARFVVAGSNRAWAAFPRSWIRGAAEIDPAHGLTPTEERQLAAHYGIPVDAGRPAALSERAFDELSSVPDSCALESSGFEPAPASASPSPPLPSALSAAADREGPISSA
jgi:hypothetical protein